MVIKIDTIPRKFFRQALEVLRNIPPLSSLRNKELDVLAELLYFNDRYSNIPQDLRWKLVFDYDTKMDIITYLDMKDVDLYNILTSLRKKGIIKGRQIDNTFGIRLSDPTITFNFVVNGEDVQDRVG